MKRLRRWLAELWADYCAFPLRANQPLHYWPLIDGAGQDEDDVRDH